MKTLLKILAFQMCLCGLSDFRLFAQTTSENKESIEQIWKKFTTAWENQDAEVCAGFYLNNGVNIPPDLPINSGSKAIADFYEMLFKAHLSSEYKHTIIDLHQNGDELVERGAFSVNWIRNDGSAWKFKARSLTHWVNDANGDWRIKTLIFNKSEDN